MSFGWIVSKKRISDDQEKVLRLEKVLSPWQNELRTVYPPFPLLNVFKQELMRKYGDEDKTREAYNELLKENKSRDIHFTDIGSLDFIKGFRSEYKTVNDSPTEQ